MAKPRVIHVPGATQSIVFVTFGIASLAAACGSSSSSGEMMADGGGEEPAIIESRAPLCADIAASESSKELFSHALVDPSKVSDALVFGGMEPAAPQEVLNYELGFYIPESDVALTSPTNLFIESVERSYHEWNDVTDWGISYHVCSYQDGNVRRAAVLGNFAHVTTLNAGLSALFEEELEKFLDGQPSAVSCSDPENKSCGLNVNALRDLLEDPEYVFVVEAGAALGTAGPLVGKNSPAGIDANLIDRRTNDYSGNYYINPNRLGAAAGPGLAWRYGACTYEYFVEPYRTQYLGDIRIMGEQRVSAESPCGTLEVDRDAEGTVAGLWAMAAMEQDVMGDSFGGSELDAYLENLLVLADHMTSPDTKMMLSTPIAVLSDLTGEASAIEFVKAQDGDANWQKRVNIPFRATEPGSTYCYAGTRYGGFETAYYLAEVSQDGSTLTLERVMADCTDVAPASRSFDSGSESYFVFVR